MKYLMVAVAGVGFLAASALAQQEKAAPKAGADSKAGADLKDTKSKASYGVGLQLGKSFKAQSLDLDPDVIARGIRDAFAGKAQITDQEIQAAFQALQEEVAARKEKAQAAFLADNKKKPGVTTLPSGLQYRVIKQGTGQSPAASDTVSVNYRGTLTDGTEFDSSAKHGGPAEFRVNQVIPGWTEALQLMKVGSKWELVIPSNLAYGPRAQRAIPANSTLVFEVELLGIKK